MDLIKLTPDEFAQLARVVYQHTGIHLPQEKIGLLSNRLRKRLRALGLDSFRAYHDILSCPEGLQEELPHFLSAVTTNETYFFRNEQLWEFFRKELVPWFLETRARTRSIRIWSAASSSGEEAHTAAIALREAIPDVDRWRVTIVGSDISRAVLGKAQAGLYNDYAVSKMPAAQVDRWFHRVPGGFQLRDEVRRMVRFQFHNLRDSMPDARFDLVFLRNVLMYFDTPMKKRVLEVVTEALVPGGYLIIGDVDPVRTIPELSRSLAVEYRRPGTYQKPVAGAAGPQKHLVTT